MYALDNIALTSLPIIFLIVGVLGALWGPIGRKLQTAPVPGPPDYSSFVSQPPPEPPPPPAK